MGSDPTGLTPPSATAREPGPLSRVARTIRRIAEEEFILVVLLAGFGLIFLLIFPPFLLVNDSWLNLMSGREVWENGLPSTDELTVYGAGRTWTDQQWLAHLFFYGLHGVGGHALIAVAACAVVVGAFSIAAAGARVLGAGPRAIWVALLPVLLAAPWAWTIRAQLFALPLYTGLLWLLASEARRPSRRVWLALPLLVVWANLHGSVALGVLLTMLLGLYELVRRWARIPGVRPVGSDAWAGVKGVRPHGSDPPAADVKGVRPHGSDPAGGVSWLRSLVLLVLAPLAALVTPYGPVDAARYYHLLLVDPPFAGRVTEWNWAAPAVNTMFFYVLVALAIPVFALGRRRLTLFDGAVLAITLVGAVTAIRGIAWFALACMLYVPVAIGPRLESRSPAPLRRPVNLAISTALVGALAVVAVVSLVRDSSWYEQNWSPEPVEAVRETLEPGDLVYAPDRFSDWLLWKIPELRGRVAYDVRFEIYDEEFFERLARYGAEAGDDWKELAAAYRIVLVDETVRSHTDDFLAEPGARAIYRGDELTVIVRRPTS